MLLGVLSGLTRDLRVVVMSGFGEHIYQVHINEVSKILFLGWSHFNIPSSLSFIPIHNLTKPHSLAFRNALRPTARLRKTRSPPLLPPYFPPKVVSRPLQDPHCYCSYFRTNVGPFACIPMSSYSRQLGYQCGTSTVYQSTGCRICWCWEQHRPRPLDYAVTGAFIIENSCHNE